MSANATAGWKREITIDLVYGHVGCAILEAYQGDNRANIWSVTVLNKGVPADLSDYTVRAYFMRPDGHTIDVAGTITNNTATVELDEHVYVYLGRVSGTLVIEKTDYAITLDAMKLNILKRDTETITPDDEHFVVIGSGTLDTEAQTVVGAVNELNTNNTTLENLIYKNDKTNIVPEIMAYYKGKSQMASVADMPAWSYIYASGTEAAALLPDFDFTLTPNRTYIIECRTLSDTENIRLYRVYVPSSFVEFYVGYKRSDSETYVWNDVKAPQNAASDYIVQAVEDDIPEMFVYTDLAEIAKYWTPEGSLGNDSLSHTQNLRIIPGGKCYVRNVVGQACQGAWFDQYGRWIAPLLDTDMTDYVYKNPDCGSGAAGTYVTLKEFTAPASAHYLSLNLVVSQQYKYMSFLASKPVFPLANTGNILVPKGYAAYQAKKGKKLCVIGPSTAMIGRRYIDKPASNPLNQFLCGWQEYIAPWYALCESYGFSGGSYGTLYTTYKSIYDGIVTDALDLSGYDDYILMASTNGLSTTGVGDWGNVYDEPGTHEHDTYMGGLRGVVDYIMQQNSMANIYLMTMIGTNNYFGSTYVTYRNNVLSINDKTRDMALKMHLRLIDLAADCGFNAANIYDASDPTAGLTYDGIHYNQAGCYLVGSAVRHRVIGI